MANAFIDEAMRSYGGKEWRFESLPVPRCEVKMPGDMDAPITVEDFLSCCRQPSGVKTTVMILDVQLAVSDCGSPGDVALALKEQRVASLPVALHFAESPPADSKVGGIVMDKGNGQLDVIKYVTFKDKVPTREATKLAGSAYVPFPRPGPWSVKKAFQSLLHIHRLQEDAVPGWRRAKSLDNFRHQVANVYEGIFLDDPNRENISMADLKSFLTVEEEQTTSGRYNDAKLTRNCMRAYASNYLDQADEPADDSRTSITSEEFMKMTRRLFAEMACLKRSLLLLIGQHASGPLAKIQKAK